MLPIAVHIITSYDVVKLSKTLGVYAEHIIPSVHWRVAVVDATNRERKNCVPYSVLANSQLAMWENTLVRMVRQTCLSAYVTIIYL